MNRLLIVGLLGFALAGCSNNDSEKLPVTVTPQAIADASKRCDPYGGVATIKIYQRASWADSGEYYELRCLDHTRVDVSSWQGEINAAQVAIEPQPSKKP